MKLVYNLMYFINIICGILLSINYLFIYNYTDISLVIFCLELIIYAFFIKNYLSIKQKISKQDLLFMIVYYFIIIFIIIGSVILQAITFVLYNMVYYQLILLIPHILYLLYNYKTT